MPSSTTVIADILGAASDGLSNATFGDKYGHFLQWTNFWNGFIAKGFSLIDKAYLQDTPACWEKKLGTALGLAGFACLSLATYLNASSSNKPVKEGWSNSWLGGDNADLARNLFAGGGLLLNASAAFFFNRAEKLPKTLENDFKALMAKLDFDDDPKKSLTTPKKSNWTVEYFKALMAKLGFDDDPKKSLITPKKSNWTVEFEEGTNNFTATFVNKYELNDKYIRYIEEAIKLCVGNIPGLEVKPMVHNQGIEIVGFNRDNFNYFKINFEAALHNNQIKQIAANYRVLPNPTRNFIFNPITRANTTEIIVDPAKISDTHKPKYSRRLPNIAPT